MTPNLRESSRASLNCGDPNTRAQSAWQRAPRPSASASIQNRERRRRPTLFSAALLRASATPFPRAASKNGSRCGLPASGIAQPCLAIRRHIGYETSSTFGRTFGPPCLVRPKRASDTLSNDRLGWRAKRRCARLLSSFGAPDQPDLASLFSARNMVPYGAEAFDACNR